MRSELRASGVVWSLASALLFAGCATKPSEPCNPGQAVAFGAIAGAVIGSMTGGKPRATAAGVALGGAVGALACLAVNADSRRTKSAAVATAEALARAGQLPPNASLVVYQSSVEPAFVQPGANVLVKTVVEIAHGRQEAAADLKEQLTLIDTDGNEHRLGVKSLGEGRDRAGRFENSFFFTLPKGVSKGGYAIKTAIVLNGRQVGERLARLNVTQYPTAMYVYAALPMGDTNTY